MLQEQKWKTYLNTFGYYVVCGAVLGMPYILGLDFKKAFRKGK